MQGPNQDEGTECRQCRSPVIWNVQAIKAGPREINEFVSEMPRIDVPCGGEQGEGKGVVTEAVGPSSLQRRRGWVCWGGVSGRRVPRPQ